MRAAVLIVDDSADKLVALESILLDLQVDIVKARSGREALRCLLARDFAVILLDVRMPEMDGFETATLIRRRARSEHTPIIFVTAYGDETHVARGYSLKAVDYLMTPVVPDVLRTKVRVFADLFVMAAEVKRQARSLERRAAQLHGLTEASLAINSASTVDRMLQVVAESAREMLGAERASVLATLDEHRTRRAVCLAPGAARDEEGDGAVSAIVCRTNGPYRSAAAPAAVDDTGPARGAPPARVLGVPLTGRDGRNLGAVQATAKRDAGLAGEDQDLLVQLAQMTSIAIENTLFSEAREANRLKDEFLATVSHELRTPLSAILSWAWMLRRGGLDAETSPRAVEAIIRNAKAQGRLVDDLLDVSRIVTGKLKLTRQPVEVPMVVRSAAETLAAAAEAKGVELHTILDTPDGAVLGDPDRLQQVVSNLLTNAIKFTSSGGRIELRVRSAGRDVEIRVTDTGAGIPAAFLPRVFERFHQADSSATRTAGGLGLGLAIVRHLVELHGGTVVAESEGEGRGSTFTVRLPGLREEEVAAVDGDHAPRDWPGANGGGLHGRRILIVEDNEDTREALVLTVSAQGADVTAVGTAHEAYHAIRSLRPDLLLCDIGLPLEDGYSLIRRVRALPSEEGGGVPAIALTAYARAEDRRMALAAGFQAHVAKPVEPDVLLRALEAMVTSALTANGGDNARAETSSRLGGASV